jgi:hypothetical protein
VAPSVPALAQASEGQAVGIPMMSVIGDAGAEVVFRALSLLGVHYRFGGNTPETGLDCSGLVRLVYGDTLGLPLPRRSEEISRVGPAVAPSELQPGDLVFFNTLRRAFSHVGIYIGNNQFVHAPSSGGSIRVENLGADYWTRRFDGARRLLTQELLAAATLNPMSASATRVLQASTAAPAEPGAATLAAPGTTGRGATAPVSVGGSGPTPVRVARAKPARGSATQPRAATAATVRPAAPAAPAAAASVPVRARFGDLYVN